jgi:hypothetical protein
MLDSGFWIPDPLDLKHSNFGSLYTASSYLEYLLIISLIGIKGAQRRMMVALVLLLGPSLCPQLKPIRFSGSRFSLSDMSIVTTT